MTTHVSPRTLLFLSALLMGIHAPEPRAGLIQHRVLYVGPNAGLVGFWSFDGDSVSGTSVADLSGQGNHGTMTGGPARAKGKIGQGLSFDGMDDYVALATDTQFGGESITISAWIHIRALTTDVMDVVSKHLTGGGAKYFHTAISTAGKAGLYTFTTCGSATTELLSSTVLPLNT